MDTIGEQPFGRYREVVFIERFREPTTVYWLYESILASILATNESLLTASLAHASFEKAVGTSYVQLSKLSRLLQIMLISAIIFCWFWVWLSVLGGYFQLLKLIGDWNSLYGVERWPFLRGCLEIEVIRVSIWTWVLGRFIVCGCSLKVVVNGGSTVHVYALTNKGLHAQHLFLALGAALRSTMF